MTRTESPLVGGADPDVPDTPLVYDDRIADDAEFDIDPRLSSPAFEFSADDPATRDR
jgi:hypothetical protein